MSLDELLELAAVIGVAVTEHTGGKRGYYVHSTRTISIRTGLNHRTRRCVLAHELAHAIRGDEPVENPHFHARQERAADQAAARMLIDPGAYRLAEQLYPGDTAALCRELEVTSNILAAWQTMTPRPI